MHAMVRSGTPMRLHSYALVTIALGLGVAAAACGGSDGVPLGGPYGGTGSSPPPSAGQSTDGTDPAADPGNSDPGSTSSTSSTSSSSTSSTSSGSSGKSSTSSGGSSGGSSSGGTSSSGGSSGTTSTATWSKIYSAYLGSGTTGRCNDCHGQCATASGCYTWLKGKSQIPDIADPQYSCLSWLGGNMPPRGPKSNAAASADLSAWAAAGGQNN